MSCSPVIQIALDVSSPARERSIELTESRFQDSVQCRNRIGLALSEIRHPRRPQPPRLGETRPCQLLVGFRVLVAGGTRAHERGVSHTPPTLTRRLGEPAFFASAVASTDSHRCGHRRTEGPCVG